MNKFAYILLIVVFSLVSLVAFGEVTVVYTSGPCRVDVNGDENWKPAELHMKLTDLSVIKTGAGGAIELEIEGHSIAIGENTTVSLNYIMANMTKRKKVGWFRSFSGLFRKEKGQGNTALLGVRGAKAEGKEDEMDWIGDESELDTEKNLDDAIALYNEQKYAEAISVLEQLYNTESYADRKGEIAFYLGSCYFDGLQYDRASEYFSTTIEKKDSPYYEEALLKYGFSEYFQGNYRNAIEGFTDYSRQYGDREIIPYVQLMIGKSYKELGEEDSASKYLNRVMQKYKGSEASKEAARELGK